MIKSRAFKQAANVLVSRLVPGALNVVALLALAAWLSRQSYGLASTFIATATAGADILFGPIYHSVLVHYSEHRARGEHRRFESVHLANTLLLAAAVGAGGVILAVTGLVDWRIVAAIAAVGSYTSVQEISHARLQFYRFAVGSSSQSLAFLLLAYLMVRPNPTVETAVEAFAISYAIGAFFSALLVRPNVTLPSIPMLKSAFSLGTMPALSNLVVTAFGLACRYVMLLFGRADALGVFSFSLDIAQRGVGIFINLATFAIVPHALKSSEGGTARELWRRLARGWSAAVLVSLTGAAAIIGLGATHVFEPLNRPIYDPVSFGLICVAVIVSRSSKMLLSPVAMRLRRTRLLLTPMLFVAPIVMALVLLGLALRVPYTVELGFTVAFIVSSWFAYRAIIGHIDDRELTTAGLARE
jgi:hypothetical protein